MSHRLKRGIPILLAVVLTSAPALAPAGEEARAVGQSRKTPEKGFPSGGVESQAGPESPSGDPQAEDPAEAAKPAARPCEQDPRYRAFDFWVGEWEVYSGGRKVGTNRIEKQLSGCLIFEHWTSVTGFSGKSMNYLDPETGTWRQNWVAERGYIIRYEGEIRDGAMHFEGENIGFDGTKALQRVILKPLPDGTLHHRIEQSTDKGKSWKVWFDGTYTRRGSGRCGGN